jgi:hypothetical protein
VQHGSSKARAVEIEFILKIPLARPRRLFDGKDQASSCFLSIGISVLKGDEMIAWMRNV